MVNAMQTLWKQARSQKPQRVQTDDGTEFMNVVHTLTYLKALPTIVKQYNQTVHSSIQEKPVHVTPDNEYLIWNRLYKKRLRNRGRPKLRVGDKVRLNKKHRVFQKE